MEPCEYWDQDGCYCVCGTNCMCAERERNANCERRLKKLESLGFKDAADFARNPNED